VIKLRLRRMGAKKQPSYRIVAAESRMPRDGRFIEIVGHYDPKTDPYTLHVDEERARHYLDNGAQPTETVRALLVKSGVLPPYEGPSTAEAAQAAAAAAETDSAPAGDSSSDDAEVASQAEEEVAEEESAEAEEETEQQ
jgi:small subunit ribosomal protein S16